MNEPPTYPLPDPRRLAHSYYVDLLYEQAPVLRANDFRERLRQELERTAAGEISLCAESGPEDTGTAPVLRMRYVGQLLDAADPPEWRLHQVPPPSAEEMARHLGQSWWWPDAAAAISPATAALRLSDHRHLSLDCATRMRRFRRALAAILLAQPALAVAWTPTQQLVEPKELLTHLEAHGFDDPLPGAINVRFFRVEREGPSDGADREAVMDTLGLTALGLTDLQCHFRGLDPDEVGNVLYNTALYLLSHGAILGEGNTVQGSSANDRWLCRRRPALCEPQREVLDLDPGFPFKVGIE